MSKLILAVESSCDETACAVSRDGREILADVVYSQADMHALYGGVVPEIASRKHIEKVSLVAQQALEQAGVSRRELDAVAATCAPGLIGALLVGANFAKGVSWTCPLSRCITSGGTWRPIMWPSRSFGRR